MNEYEELFGRYANYVDGYRNEDGTLPEMMQLKFDHTARVVENARLIAEGEKFSETEARVSVAAALLHDTGRYEQLKRFDTFEDSRSIDHAVFSHDIVKSQKWLDATEFFRAHSETILAAVLYHNRREITGGLDELTRRASETVRDADKLDIFRVLEQQVRRCGDNLESRAFWNLQVGVPPNPAVVEAIAAGRPVPYADIRSLADFVLIQIGWMISGLVFATSRRLCRERGHLAFRRDFLNRIGGGKTAADLCDLAESKLA